MMNKNQWKELGLQALTGFVYGAIASASVIQEVNWKIALIAVASAGLKAAANAAMTYFQKKSSTVAKSIKSENWSSKFKNYL